MSDASAALPGRQRDTSRDVLGWVVFGLVGIVVYAHLYFTVEFTDSAYSVALPYSFSLGHRPLVDELAVQQLAGLMLQPFIELLALVGSRRASCSLLGTPDVVVRMKCVPTRRLFKLRFPDTDAVARRIFQAKYDLASERECYKLFKKTSETAPPTAPVS